jgi:hypothetical protein
MICQHLSRQKDTRNGAFNSKIDRVRLLSDMIYMGIAQDRNCADWVEEKSDLLCELHDMIDAMA